MRRQLAGLPHRREAGLQPVGDRRAENESAALDADHQVDRLAQVRRGHRLDGQLKPFAVLQQRRDVVEQDSRPSENPARAESAASALPSTPRSSLRPDGSDVEPRTSPTRPSGGSSTTSTSIDTRHRGPRANLPLEPLDGFSVAFGERLDRAVGQISDPACEPFDRGASLQRTGSPRPERGRSRRTGEQRASATVYHARASGTLLHDDRARRRPCVATALNAATSSFSAVVQRCRRPSACGFRSL